MATGCGDRLAPPREEQRQEAGRFYVTVTDSLAEHRLGNNSDPARAGLVSVGDEPVWATPAWHVAMSAAGIGNFDATMQPHVGICMRALADRENWRLELAYDGTLRTGYLKKHHVWSWWSYLSAWAGLGPCNSAARVEAQNIRRLEAAGIPCMELAAYGERLRHDGLLESFLLTPDLEGFTPLDDFLRARFGQLNTEGRENRDADLLRLTDRVATIARQFHEAGFNHRDLYCCHFFVREGPAGDFEIRLIDLQRVQHRKRLRRRWLVKDLAQLAYSAPRDRIKCTQKMAFIRRYFGVSKLRPEHKRLIREVLAKQRAMERKLGRTA